VLACISIMAIFPFFASSRISSAQEPIVIKKWDFQHDSEGWTYGNEINDPVVKNSILNFTSEGNDPILYASQYDPIPANNRQKIEIRLKADSPGMWELFYTNTDEGRFGGYDQKWSLRFHVSAKEEWQTVSIRPFWKAIGHTIKIRFDPACGHYQIDWIRIVETTEDNSISGWMPEHNVQSLEAGKDALIARSSGAGCSLLKFTDIDASTEYILFLRASGKNVGSLSFCWANDLATGLHTAGLPVDLDGSIQTANINLSEFKGWQGKVDTVGFIFGESPDDELIIKDFSISSSPQGEAELRLEQLITDPMIRRPGQNLSLSAYIRNKGGKAFPGGEISIIDPAFKVSKNIQNIKPLEFDERTVVKWDIRLGNEDSIVNRISSPWRDMPVEIGVGNQILKGSMRIEPALSVVKDDYIPVPNPISTKPYEIGVYYFPGWSPDQWNRWEKQKGFPERDPVLGFYREGDPEVADWHIKWAAENGITFFMYDWYWRDGNITLEKGLGDGYLKSKYMYYIKFCVMWANHAPFANHTPEQLLTVTDYWIDKYFSLDCYYKIDGKPVVSFFAPDNLTHDLGGSENVRLAFDAMRRRVQDAGLPGIYFIACGDNSPVSQKRFKSEGYDAISAYNSPSAGATSQWSSYSSMMQGHVNIWNNSLREPLLDYIPFLTVGWDSRPWHGNDALVRFGRSTQHFREGLMAMKNWMDKHDKRIALLEAWNEWGEGSYIEPNAEFGFGDLEAIREVFARTGKFPQNVAPSDFGMGTYDISRIEH